MEQVKKVVIKIPDMADAKTKQKAIEAAAKFQGIDSIAADLEEQIMIIIGQVDSIAIANRLTEKIGKVEIVSVRPTKEGKKEQKKDDKKEQEKEIRQEEKPKKEEKEKLKKEEPKKEKISIIIGDQMYRIATANAKRVEIVSIGPAKEEKKEGN